MSYAHSWSLLAIGVISFLTLTFAQPEQSELLERPAQIITSEVGGFDFTDIGTVLPLENGALVATHPSTDQLLLISPTGRVVRVAGGTGTGSRQFRRLGAVGQIGDSIWALDAAQLRAMLYDTSLTLIRTFQLPLIPLAPTGRLARPQMLLANGTIHAFGSSTLHTASGPPRNLYPLVIARRDGSAPQTIARAAESQVAMSIRFNDGTVHNLPSAIDDRTLVAQDPESVWIVLLDRQVGAKSTPRVYYVTVLNASGDTVWHKRYATAAKLVPQGLVDSIRGMVRAGTSARAADSMLQRIPAEILDPFALVAGAKGVVWVGERTRSPDQALWRMLDDTGTERLAIRLHSEYRVLAVRGLNVWTVSRRRGQAVLSRFTIPARK